MLKPAREPNNWSKQHIPLQCPPGFRCQWCSALQKFFDDPAQRECSFVVRPGQTQADLQHLHTFRSRVIDGYIDRQLRLSSRSTRVPQLSASRGIHLTGGSIAYTVTKHHPVRTAGQPSSQLVQQHRQLADQWLACMLRLLAVPGATGDNNSTADAAKRSQAETSAQGAKRAAH